VLHGVEVSILLVLFIDTALRALFVFQASIRDIGLSAQWVKFIFVFIVNQMEHIHINI